MVYNLLLENDRTQRVGPMGYSDAIFSHSEGEGLEVFRGVYAELDEGLTLTKGNRSIWTIEENLTNYFHFMLLVF